MSPTGPGAAFTGHGRIWHVPQLLADDLRDLAERGLRGVVRDGARAERRLTKRKPRFSFVQRPGAHEAKEAL